MVSMYVSIVTYQRLQELQIQEKDIHRPAFKKLVDKLSEDQDSALQEVESYPPYKMKQMVNEIRQLTNQRNWAQYQFYHLSISFGRVSFRFACQRGGILDQMNQTGELAANLQLTIDKRIAEYERGKEVIKASTKYDAAKEIILTLGKQARMPIKIINLVVEMY